MSEVTSTAVAAELGGRALDTGMLHSLLTLRRGQLFAEQKLVEVMSRFADLDFRIREASRAGVLVGRPAIRTVRDALDDRGYRGLHHAGLASAYATTLPRESLEPRYADFWRHAGATALLTRVVAVVAETHNDQAFGAGLLHTVGHFALALHAGPAEATATGLQASDVAVEVLRGWRIPEPIVRALALQGAHRPGDAAGDRLAEMVAEACAGARVVGLVDPLEGERDKRELRATAAPALAALERFGGRQGLGGMADEILAAALVAA